MTQRQQQQQAEEEQQLIEHDDDDDDDDSETSMSVDETEECQVKLDLFFFDLTRKKNNKEINSFSVIATRC